MATDASELEIQQALQRFATELSGNVGEATERLERSRDARVRDAGLRRSIAYVSSALEIAAGPVPVINLFDMFVFVRLCRFALERHWMPLYDADGAAIAEVFAGADQEISALVARTCEPAWCAQLTELVEAWIADNPDQTVVEAIRLSDFADAAGAALAARASQVRGLLSSVRSATRSATDAVQIAERALFLSQRLPFVWRAQVRLGVREIFDDISLRISDTVRSQVDRVRTFVRRGIDRALDIVPPRLRRLRGQT
jgi:hypothetical protein